MSAVKRALGREEFTEVKRYLIVQRVCSTHVKSIPLFFACYFGLETLVYLYNELTSKKVTRWSQKNIASQTPMDLVVYESHENICRALIDCGADVNKKIHYPSCGVTTAYGQAMYNEDFSIFSLFLRATILPFDGRIRGIRYSFLMVWAAFFRRWDRLLKILEFAKVQGDKILLPLALLPTLAREERYEVCKLLLQESVIQIWKEI
jgi:hypothetical protein